VGYLIKKLNKLGVRQQYLLALGFFAVLIAIFYAPSLSNGFVWDDRAHLEQNTYVRSVKYIPQAFTGCVTTEEECASGRLVQHRRRPLYFVSAILTYQISSSPWLFHFVNLIYFFIATVLVFLFTKVLTKNYLLSLTSAFIFAIHPIHSGVVNYISAMPELLMTIFVLASGILYIRYREKKSLTSLGLVYLLYFFAILSKEPAFLFPIIPLALDILFFKKQVKELVQWRELKNYLLFGVPAFLYIVTHTAGIFNPQVLYGGLSTIERAYAFVIIFGTALWKIFAPHPLVMAYPFQGVSTLLSAPFLVSFGFMLLFVGSIVLLVRKKERVLAFSLIWFAAFLLLVMIVVGGRGGDLFAERYLFLPSVGFSIATAFLFVRFLNYSTLTRRAAVAVFILFVGISWFIVFDNTQVWKNNITLHNATLKHQPRAIGLHNSLLREYLLENDIEKAERELEEIIERAPINSEQIIIAHHAFGDFYSARGDIEKAVDHYTKGIESSTDPRTAPVYNNLGIIYMQQERYLEGFASFCASLQLFSDIKTQANFERALFLVNENYIQTNTLHQALIETFTQAQENHIKYLETRCDSTSCQNAFAVSPSLLDVIPPFLITATQPHAWRKDTQLPIEITNQSFDPTASVIILEVDARYEGSELTFLFPTCSGEYYEATTS